MSTTIAEVAGRIRDRFDLSDDAALSTAQTYWRQIRYIDDGLTAWPDAPEGGQELSDADADFIVESTRQELETEGLL